MSIGISTQIQRSFFEDAVSRPTVFPTKSRKFYQRLLDLFIWIHENTWEGSKNFSVLSNFTVINIIRTSHGNNKKYWFFFCRLKSRIFWLSTRLTTRFLSVLFSTAMVRWVSPEVMIFSWGLYTRVKKTEAQCVVLSLSLLFEISVADSVSVIRYSIKIMNPNTLGPLEVVNR